MPRKSHFSVQKRERESRKNERRVRKAERAAAKRDPPGEAPAADSAVQIPASNPPSEAPELGQRSHSIAPPGLPENPVDVTTAAPQGNTA